VAGKTGTTQNNTDGWFILMHPRLVAGAWVGFNDARVTMRSNYWGEGAHNALPMVGDFFQRTLASRLIDGGAAFPFARPSDSILEPFFDAAKDWFGGILEGLFGGSTTTRREPMPRERESERELTMERLLDLLRQKQDQRRQEYREMEKPSDGL
jgi:penicillin-binding protein 1A